MSACLLRWPVSRLPRTARARFLPGRIHCVPERPPRLPCSVRRYLPLLHQQFVIWSEIRAIGAFAFGPARAPAPGGPLASGRRHDKTGSAAGRGLDSLGGGVGGPVGWLLHLEPVGFHESGYMRLGCPIEPIAGTAVDGFNTFDEEGALRALDAGGGPFERGDAFRRRSRTCGLARGRRALHASARGARPYPRASCGSSPGPDCWTGSCARARGG